MDANTIITLVGSLGFPVVACIGMAYFCNRIITDNRADYKEITQAINNNTLVIQKLADKLEDLNNDNH